MTESTWVASEQRAAVDPESPQLSTWSGFWNPATTAPKAEALHPGTALVTHTGATHEHNEDGLQDAGYAHNPRQTQEEDHAENVLQAGQVDADEGAHAWALRETEQWF